MAGGEQITDTPAYPGDSFGRISPGDIIGDGDVENRFGAMTEAELRNYMASLGQDMIKIDDELLGGRQRLAELEAAKYETTRNLDLAAQALQATNSI
jgi:hypothetical protein